jgi:hypothetical protein
MAADHLHTKLISLGGYLARVSLSHRLPVRAVFLQCLLRRSNCPSLASFNSTYSDQSTDRVLYLDVEIHLNSGSHLNSAGLMSMPYLESRSCMDRTTIQVSLAAGTSVATNVILPYVSRA